MQVGVITNPNSKKNYRRPHRRRSLEQAVARHGVVRETSSLDELPAVAAELLDAGCKYWVCDGGDGTLHWVLNSLYTVARERSVTGAGRFLRARKAVSRLRNWPHCAGSKQRTGLALARPSCAPTPASLHCASPPYLPGVIGISRHGLNRASEH